MNERDAELLGKNDHNEILTHLLERLAEVEKRLDDLMPKSKRTPKGE